MLSILRKTVFGIITTGLVLWAMVWVFLQQPSFGQEPSGLRMERIKKSPNFHDGIFKNLVETPMKPEGVSYWKMGTTLIFDKDENNTPPMVLPCVKNNLQASITNKPVITWFGHSTVLIQVNGKNILTDPMFSQRPSPVQFTGPSAFKGTQICSVKELPLIDVVLISHNHYDHLDYHTIMQLKDKTKLFYVALGVGAYLEQWGIPLSKIREMDWWEESVIDSSLKIVFTPSRHFSGRGPAFNKTQWCSYVMITPQYRFYFSGDSGYEKHFKMIGEKYGPFDMAFIETGQYNNLWPNIHMMPENSVQAAADLGAKVMMPIHWSKFALSTHAWDEPIKRSQKKAIELHVKMTTPMLGEYVIIDSIYPVLKWWDSVKK